MRYFHFFFYQGQDVCSPVRFSTMSVLLSVTDWLNVVLGQQTLFGGRVNFKLIEGNTKVEFYIFFVLHTICKIKEEKMPVVCAVI